MKKLIIFCSVLLGMSLFATAQEFSFPLYVEDAIGNKDTIILGYDENGTQGEDLNFGEVDIKDIPFSGALDMRAVDYDFDLWTGYEDQTLFHSKIQIVKTRCEFQGPFPPVGIAIKADHYPLRISWDSTLFSALCNNQTLFTDLFPGFWFDPPSDYNTFFRLRDSSSAISTKYYETTSYPINNNEDTVKVFFLGFIPDATISTKDDLLEDQGFEISPNPASEVLNIYFKNNQNRKDGLFRLVDINGRIVLELKAERNDLEYKIPLEKYASGIYLLQYVENGIPISTQQVIIQKINWSTANVERGIYFYSLIIDDKKQETKKLVLIK
jgi:hypothetical protein